jgi:hypothetical protein
MLQAAALRSLCKRACRIKRASVVLILPVHGTLECSAIHGVWGDGKIDGAGDK